MNKILLAILPLVVLGCGGQNNGSFNTNPDKVEVDMTSNNNFSPQTVVVHPGTVIDWYNAGTDLHSVKADLFVPGMDSDGDYPDGIPRTATFEWTVPDNAAIGAKYYYHCKFHGTAGDGTTFGTGMTGVVIVQ